MMEVATPARYNNDASSSNFNTNRSPARMPGAARQSAPAPPPPAMAHNFQPRQMSHHSSNFSDYSNSTQATTTSTLFGGAPPLPTSTPVNGGPVEAANNVLNRRADKEQSLFQICRSLRTRLMGLPEVANYILQQEQAADDDEDIVTILWKTFRQGLPLLAIYNSLKPPVPLQVVDPRMREDKREKAATFKFVQACQSELKIPSSECFIIADLYGDDTSGFVKVAKVVNRVLDVLVATGILVTEAPEDASRVPNSVKRTQRQHIILELVNTERTYVQHLELLLAFKNLVEEKGVIPGDIVHDIFLNLNALLDLQQRFLIRVEQTNVEPEERQNWGKLFVVFKDAFKVYEPYIANQKRSEELAMREFDKLKAAGGSVEMRQMVESPTHFSSFLLKPFQRLSKYPLLLRELQKKGDLDEQRKADVAQGIEAASAVLTRINHAIDLEQRIEAVEELKNRVEDWKGHNIERFGSLLLHGTFTVLKGDSTNPKDSEREYKIYLFEVILLCCKEINPHKQKNKIMNKQLVDKRGNPKLQLKGRIFMQNVTETVSFSKPGAYTCQIFWKGDPGIENFVIRFTTEESMKKWVQQVDIQRRACHHRSRSGSNPRHTGTSNTEFNYLKDSTPLENPYAEDDVVDDDSQTVVSSGFSDYSRSTRKDSTFSQRSRSTTSESAGSASTARAPPPRFPMTYGAPNPLSLRTQQLQQNAIGLSPGERPAAESYFSPAMDSPMSSRTSSSSGMLPFPRQPSVPNGWHPDDQNRYTAPAMGRTVSRDGQQYPPSRGASRPSLPPTAVAHQQQYQQQLQLQQQQGGSAQSRMRSASSPDIHNPLNRRPANGQPPVPDVPVPPFPTHIAYSANLSRSQTNSPSNPSPLPSTQPRMMPAPSAYDYHGDPRGLSRGSPHPNGPTAVSADPRSMTPGTDAHQFPSRAPTSAPRATDGAASSDSPIPSQLKVKVHCPSAGSTMTLVVSTNISFQSLKDRIDAKLQRATTVSLSSGQVKLKYLDEEDFVSIQSDEDVQTAFETWKEQQRDHLLSGSLGEIELYCQ